MKRSYKQLQAARLNGAKSRGPKTTEGKSISSQNAFKHGVYSQRKILLNEDRESFDEHIADYMRDYAPATKVETHIVEQIAESMWRIERYERIENDLIDEGRENLHVHGATGDRQLQKSLTAVMSNRALIFCAQQVSRYERMAKRFEDRFLRLKGLRKRNEPEKSHKMQYSPVTPPPQKSVSLPKAPETPEFASQSPPEEAA